MTTACQGRKTPRFGRGIRRLSARLLSPRNFGRGMAPGRASPYGKSTGPYTRMHPQRVASFPARPKGRADLPRLSGRAPLGGVPLSHDFVRGPTGRGLRRRGLDSVELDPPPALGRASCAPRTHADRHQISAASHRNNTSSRSPLWCQGKSQHCGLIAEPLSPQSCTGAFRLGRQWASTCTAPIC